MGNVPGEYGEPRSPLACARQALRSGDLGRGLSANLARVVPHTVLTFAFVQGLRDWRGSTLSRALHHNRGAP